MTTMAATNEHNPNTAVAGTAETADRDKVIAMMLYCKTHLGTRNCEEKMKRYVYSRSADGCHIFNLLRTWEKLQLAARILVAVENPADIVVVSARPYGSRAILKFAQYTGAQAIAGRWTPGSLTNQITKKFVEPRVLLVTDPRTDAQAVRECAYANIPVIAMCNTDACLPYVDVVIPCNNKSVSSIALMYWLLARAILRMRGAVPMDEEWEVMPDLFFWRDPEAKPRDEVEAPHVADEEAARQQQPTEFAAAVAPWDEGGNWEQGGAEVDTNKW